MVRLRKGPVTVPTPDGPLPVTYAFLVDALRGALTFPPVWSFAADQLTATAQAADPHGVLRSARVVPATGVATGAAAAMPGARLLVVEGAGHPASFVPDRCLAAETSAYLRRGQLPATGAVCRPDDVPFAR